MTTTGGAVPWIGMPAQIDSDGDEQYLSRHYSDAIAAAGGMPVIIPLLANARSVLSLVEDLDGILLPGSNSDLDPSLYGASRSDACGPAHPLRDQMDLFLLETAVRCKIPVLAICFGIQSLNVFFGGSLIQDIPTIIGTSIRHNNPESRGLPCHKIEISPGSVLEDVTGGLEVMVNSTHHQAIERPGQGLDVVALAPDGVIESVFYARKNHWILGVQWHPERSFSYDGFSRKLFEHFLARCRAVRGIDEGSHT
jgi:putative glutamine amidotransferase